jgi:hypothetical protein
VIALVLAPFVLARALKFVPAWRDLWIPTLVFGVGTIAAAVVGGAIGDGVASLDLRGGGVQLLSGISFGPKTLRTSNASGPSSLTVEVARSANVPSPTEFRHGRLSLRGE